MFTYPGWTASLPVSLMASKTLGTFMYDWLDAPGPTQIDSSAADTNRAFESAVEKMATDWIPMSLQVRATRSEISPRFAIKTLLNGFLLPFVVEVEKYDDDDDDDVNDAESDASRDRGCPPSWKARR